MADIRDFFRKEEVEVIDMFPAGNYVEVEFEGETQLWLINDESYPEDVENSFHYTEEEINSVTDKLIVI